RSAAWAGRASAATRRASLSVLMPSLSPAPKAAQVRKFALESAQPPDIAPAGEGQQAGPAAFADGAHPPARLRLQRVGDDHEAGDRLAGLVAPVLGRAPKDARLHQRFARELRRRQGDQRAERPTLGAQPVFDLLL